MIKVSQVTEKSEGDIIFTPHCHSTIEVDYFIEGSGRYSVAGTEHSISPGDVFVFSNNIIHKITYIAPQPDMKILKQNVLYADLKRLLMNPVTACTW